MAMDKWIAVLFLTVSVVYGFAAFDYPLLPFERNMAFLPNTMPKMLAGLGVIVSLIIIFAPKPKDSEDDVLGSIDLNKFKEYKVGQALSLIAAMIVYALLLRPLGFVGATILFLVGTGWILGERKLHIMIPVAAIGAISIWFIVDAVLGIYLRPLPMIFE